MVRLGTGSGDMKRARARRHRAGRRRPRPASGGSPTATTRRCAAVATSAVREAENRDEFLDRAAREAGVEVEVISGVEEARLIHLGVLQAVPIFERRLLRVRHRRRQHRAPGRRAGRACSPSRSLKLGAHPAHRTASSRRDRSSTRRPSTSCRRHVRRRSRPIRPRGADQHRLRGRGRLVRHDRAARAGWPRRGRRRDRADARRNGARLTADELAGVVDGARRGPHGRPGRRAARDRRRAGPTSSSAGALILEQVFERARHRGAGVSEYALREGVLLDTLAAVATAASLHHLPGRVAAGASSTWPSSLDEDPGALGPRRPPRARAVRRHRRGARPRRRRPGVPGGGRPALPTSGLFISHAQHHKHSYYVIRNTDRLTGFTDHEIELIALIARYHRKAAPKPAHPEFAALDRRRPASSCGCCAGVLRIAIGLDRGHESRIRSVGAEVRTGRRGGRRGARRGRRRRARALRGR